MAVTAALGALALGAGTVAAVEAAPDNSVLVATIGGISLVVVAIVTVLPALLKENKPDPSRHLPETSEALAAEMRRVDELRAELKAERAETARLRDDVDMWQVRAFESGWRP